MSNYYIARIDDTRTLEHHGILKQKWGVRNGPPYPLKEGDKSSAEKKAEKKEKVKSTLKTSAKVTGKAIAATGNAASQVISNKASGKSKDEKKAINSSANNIREGTQKISEGIDKLTKDQVDLSKFSDDELRKIVNRLNMEQQYRNLTNSTSVKTGKDYVMGIMDVAIPVVTTVGSAIILKRLKV